MLRETKRRDSVVLSRGLILYSQFLKRRSLRSFPSCPLKKLPINACDAKIEALIRHSRGTDNEDEARIFVQKAAELMEKCAQLGYTPGEDGSTGASRPEAGYEAFGMEVYDIGSTRNSFVCLFGRVCDYFHCTAIFLGKHKHRKAEVYGNNANRRQALAMYEFWKKQCIALGKVANEEEDELLSKSPFSERIYSHRRIEDMVFGAFIHILRRAITNPEDVSKGREESPVLVEGQKKDMAPRKVNGAIVEKKECLPSPEYFYFFWTEYRWNKPTMDLVKEHMSLDARPLDTTKKGARKLPFVDHP